MMSEKIISVKEARSILDSQNFERKIRRLNLNEATGYILAEDLPALVDIPSFDQSSMDGYAFSFNSWVPGTALKVVDKIAAGRSDKLILKAGEAVRVFTGAPLPEGADTVVMQEKTRTENDLLFIEQEDLKQGDNFRIQGTDITKGDTAVSKDTLVSSGTIGFLAALGYDKVPVFSAPSVALIITGNELQQPGSELIYGQVYEASSVMLQSCLKEMGLHKVNIYFVQDDLNETIKILKTALESSDVVLITGGVSVGDYDFVVKAAEECGVQKLFHKVRQRPGKPLYAGRRKNQPVFGLPGNPSSVLSCFYQYVWPVLRRMTGHAGTLKTMQVPLAASFEKKNPLTNFLKGFYENGMVKILPAQESYRLSSFVVANCLVVLDEAMRHYEKEEPVEIHLLPVYG